MSRILVVDDERSITRVLDIFLTKKGFSVLAVNSAEEALRLLQQEKFDLMVLDKKMPEMSGDEMLKVLCDRGLEIPTIILTGTLAGFGERGEEGGLKRMDVLSKPINLEVLLEAIRKKLGIGSSPASFEGGQAL